MAIEQYSRGLLLQCALILFLGWACSLLWILSQWLLHDYTYALESMTKLADKQRQALMPVAQGSLISVLPIQTHPTPVSSVPIKNYPFSFLPSTSLFKHSLNPSLSDHLTKAKQLMKLMLITSRYMLMKLMILFASLPLFALAAAAGLVDGLNQRAIRTACLGRESSYVFHRLNHYFKKFLFLALLIWLVMPISITPAYVFIPISITLAMMTALTASRFKKYL